MCRVKWPMKGLDPDWPIRGQSEGQAHIRRHPHTAHCLHYSLGADLVLHEANIFPSGIFYRVMKHLIEVCIWPGSIRDDLRYPGWADIAKTFSPCSVQTPRMVTTLGWEPISCMIFISWIRSSTSFCALLSWRKISYCFSFIKSMAWENYILCMLNLQSQVAEGNANSTYGPNWKCLLFKNVFHHLKHRI